MELQPKEKAIELPLSSSLGVAAVEVGDLTNQMNQILPESFFELERAKGEIKKKSQEIYLGGEKEEIYKRSIKNLETQIEEMKDEMKKKEEKYQESMKKLATENHKMKEKEAKYAKSLNELEIQNREMKEKQELDNKWMKELETQNGEFRDEMKKMEERIKNWLEKSWRKIRESWKESEELEEECKKRKTETEKILEDGKRKEKEAEDVISGLKRKIGELEDEQTWKEKFLRLKERIMIMWNDFEEAFEKDVTNFSPRFDEDGLADLCLRLLDSFKMLDEYFYQTVLFINGKP